MNFMQDIHSPEEAIFLPWRAEYSIGIQRFDAEHERMAAIISHLYSTMILRRDKALSMKVFERLIMETRRHFDAEEALMQDLAYPAMDPHVAEHARLIAEAQEMSRQFDLGNISALALPEFLRKWLLHHIETFDRAYRDFFHVKGIS